MGRSDLLNDTCDIYEKVSVTDSYGQFQESLVFKSTPICRWRHLSGNELILLGKPIDEVIIRFYFESTVDIQEHDIIHNRGLEYEVIWVNPLGNRTGLCQGKQVDCRFLGYCENVMSSSSSSSSIDSSSSSSIDSSSSSSSLQYSSSSSSEQYSSSSSSSSDPMDNSSSSSSSSLQFSSSSSSSSSEVPWANFFTMTINSSKVDSNLTDFPMLVKLSSSSGTGNTDLTAVFDELGENSKKIKVVENSTENECYVEIEKWDGAGEEAWLWVKAPTLNSGSNTTFTFYYDSAQADNTEYVGDVGDDVSRNVWNDDYLGAWHASETGSNTIRYDSTHNENNMPTFAIGGANGVVNQSSGKIGVGDTVDGSAGTNYGGRYLIGIRHSDAGDSSSSSSNGTGQEGVLDHIRSNADFTISLWYKVGFGSNDYRYIMTASNTANNDYGLMGLAVDTRTTESKIFAIFIAGGSAIVSGANAVEDTNWHLLTFRRNGTEFKLWRDNVVEDTQTATIDANTIEQWNQADFAQFNREQSTPAKYQRGFAGDLDEFRFAKVALSDAWIDVEYDSQADDLITYSA